MLPQAQKYKNANVKIYNSKPPETDICNGGKKQEPISIKRLV